MGVTVPPIGRTSRHRLVIHALQVNWVNQTWQTLRAYNRNAFFNLSSIWLGFMHVPRFWEKETTTASGQDGRQVEAGCWGWSENSPEEARNRALSAAKRLATHLLGGADLPNHYGYDERLPREEIIDEFEDDQGRTHAIVTRNAYGSLILNTRDLMFIDIDFPPGHSNNPLPAFLMKLLGQSAPKNAEEVVAEKNSFHRPE